MSVTKAWTEAAVKLHAATAQSAGAVNLQGIISTAIALALQTRVFKADGAVFPTFGSLVSGRPSARFETVDLKGLLDECGLTGMLVDADGTHPGVVLYGQRLAQGATRDADSASTHQSYTFENGRLVLRALELSHQGPARLSAELLPFATSSVLPVTFNETDSLPTLTEAVPAMWTLGNVDLNGTQLEGVESVSIDFGVQVQQLSRDSDVFPSFVTVMGVAPTIRIVTTHVDVTATLTEQGLGYAASQVILYARKIAEGGTFVADGTAEHISFSLGQCRVEVQAIDGDPKRAQITITPWKDGGTDPITIDTAAAIS